jgi:hypothetical protein
MKVGDLIKLKFQGNGRPRIGVVYSVDASIGYEGSVVCKCLWDIHAWNHTSWHERELEVINESW